MTTTAGGRQSPPPNYNNVIHSRRRIVPTRAGNPNRVRRLQIILVVGNWIGIIAFIVAAVVICVPVLSEELSDPLKTAIRVLGYMLMGVVAFGMLFLNCVIRRTIMHEVVQPEDRRRRQVASITTEGQELPPCPPGFLPIAEGQPGAYIGPCGWDPKDGPYGLPDYETAVAHSPPAYGETTTEQPSASHTTAPEVPITSNSGTSAVAQTQQSGGDNSTSSASN